MGQGDRAPRTVALAGLILAIVLTTVGGQRFYGAVARLNGDASLHRLANQKQLSQIELDELARTRRQALVYVVDGATQGDLALARLLQARRLPAGSRQRLAALDESIALSRAALARDPGASPLWLRLAEALLLREGIGPAPVGPLHRSIQTGPYVQGLVLGRIDLALILEPQLDDATRRDVQHQVMLIAGWKPDRLAEITRRRLALKFVRDTLEAEPSLLERFDAAYSALR